jgi:glutathione S-transferase
VVDGWLRGTPYVAGDSFTIADIGLFSYVHCAEEGGYDLQPLAATREWIARVQARPAHVSIRDARGLD